MVDTFCLECGKAEHWIVRSACGPWTPFLQGLYMLAHASIFGAYMAIGVILCRALNTVRLTHPMLPPMPGIVWYRIGSIYAAFIMCCGVGHLEGVVSFYWPQYPVFAVVHVLTALVSWLAAKTTYDYRHNVASALVGPL